MTKPEEYPEIYEVRFTDKITGEEHTDITTKDKQEALEHKESLRLLGYKNPHIQHTFKNGGATLKAENGMKTQTKFEVGYRTDFTRKLASVVGQVILGKEITIKLPNGEMPKGQFAIVELNDVLASHNEHTFSTTEGYPLDSNGQNINDRNYQQDQNAQAKVLEFAQDLQPDRLITTSRTPSGTPVITIDGVVISGNNRTMSIKLAQQLYKDKYKEYCDFLIEEINAYGIFGRYDNNYYKFKTNNQKEVAFYNPLLVRIDYDVKEYNTMELAKWNKDTKKSEKPIDKAIKLGKILLGSERCKNVISEIVGQYETFTEFYSNLADQKRIKDTLIDCNILTTQEIPAFFYEKGFTEQGKELIENLLAGMVLSQEGLVASNEGGARAFRQTIITSLPVLTQNLALGENSLTKEINEALLLQANMTNSKLSFIDLLAQTNIFGEKPSERSVYMNRLLASGRNKFKSAIESYNSSILDSNEANLFGDKPTNEEIFETIITSKIDPQERTAIEKAYPKEQSKPSEDEFRSAMQKSIETKLKEIEKPTDITKPMETSKTNPFVNGDFFIEHPEKVLATTEQGENWRTKAKITLYKGSISDVERIDADEDFLTADRESDPTISVIKQSVHNATDIDTEVADNLSKAIEQSKTDESKKALRKVKKSKPEMPGVQTQKDIDIVGLAENFAKLSPNIPMEDVMAFLVYQKDRGREITKSEWIEMTGLDRNELYSPELKTKLVEGGNLNYFNGQYLPSYLYFAENVYDKKMRLIHATENSKGSGHDKDYIIENYGLETYNNQVSRLEEVFSVQYKKRLLITGDSTTGLMVIPISEFAHKFNIKTLENELPFKWKKVTAGTNKRYGQFDLLATNVGEYDKKEIDELSLTDAFGYWLRTDETIPFHKGVTYADIIGIYLYHKPKPRGTAIADEDGKYTGIQLVIKKKEDADWERVKSKAKAEGQRLFLIFLDKALTTKDKIRLEAQWNRDFNGYVPINYNNVPVAFHSNRYFDGSPGDIESEKREAVAFTFSEGSGLLAYDVGVGKTPAAIFTISQYLDTGWATRPMLIVPNQTYKQWIAEFKKFAGHIKINEFYNLSKPYIEDFTRNGKIVQVDEGSVSIFTYEGMKQIGFSDKTINGMKNNLADILLQLDDSEMALLSNKKQDKEQEKLNSRVEKLIGQALQKSVVTMEELGFDFICFDEAHACKKVFTFVKGSAEENTSTKTDKAKGRATNEYEISSGTPSLTGIKGFMLTHYIQTRFKGNTLLLTATPFTNSPLEIYSMLSMIAYDKLKENGIDNIKTFFDTFVNVSYEMIINSKLRPQRKQVILGFNNLLPLQTLIRRFINYKSGDDVESVRKKRPNKIVLPLRNKIIDGVLMALNEEEKKDTILPFTDLQAQIMERVKDYANGTINEGELCSHGHLIDEDEGEDTTLGVELDEESLDKSEKAGVRTLKALAHARNLALSPYIFECSGLKTPTYMDYIETSNKLKYTMECIRSIKKHHADHNQSMSGIIIYMDRGKIYFPLVKEYLVKELGFANHEIGIMSSGIMEPAVKGINKEDQKEYIKNLFLGLKYNDLTQEVEPISDEQRVKVIIGSSMIREGINLQAHTSTLFNLWLDWNPSDQKQLYGRLFRQGNKFKTIRLVVPLMIDSIDIFMFEKLGQKTSRINSIWDTDGKSNAFDTTEFNPSELKRVLIKNPMVVAELELIEVAEKFEEDIADQKNIIKRLNKVEDYTGEIKNYEDDLAEWIEEYRPSNNKRSIETNIALSLEVLRKQTDKHGKPMVESWKQTKHFEEIIKTDKNGKKYKEKGREITDYYSDIEPATRQHYFNDLVIAVRGLKKETREFLEPNGLKTKDIPAFVKKKEKEIAKMEEDKKKLTDEKAIKERAKLIVEEREANKYRERDLQEVVDDFIELNAVLDEVKTPQIQQAKTPVSSCPPVDEKGVPRIDAEALKMLDECNNSLPQTKRMHTTENEQGERVYTPERQKLHEQILSKVTKDAVCTDQVQPIAVLTGGGPGSGKSTFLRKFAPYLQSDKIIKVDADEIRAGLPEYKGWNSAQTHEETRDMVNQLLNTFDQPCKHDILYDGTMSNTKKYLPLIDKLKQLGYKVYIAFMDVPREVSIQRAMQRYQDNKEGSTPFGRYVPIGVINDFFDTGKAGFENIKNDVDGYVLVDSMTGKIVENGGEPIPTDRDYKVMFENATEKAVKPQAETTESEELFNFYVVGKGKNGFDESKDIEVVATSQADAMAKAKKLKPYTTFTSAKNMGKVESAEPSKADFEASLKGAKISVKYVTGEEKTEMQKYIKGLEITIKYS